MPQVTTTAGATTVGERHEADVVIVGAGVAGALMAWKLATSGARVVLLEAGPRVNRSEAVETYRNAFIKVPEAPYPDVPYAPRPGSLDPDSYYVQAGPEPFKTTYERRVGGTTWHWLGTALRLWPVDFRLRATHGVGLDWPISYDDLEPWYTAAERALGVSGESSPTPPRSAPYPMPAIPLSYLDERVGEAVRPLGVQVQSTPQARNAIAYDGRPPCCGSASCIPICPIGAKYDASVHVRAAEAAGAQLLAPAVAHFVEVDAGRVSAVHFRRPDGSEHIASGRQYVIAAHAIETPKLLLISRSDASPDGVANSSGLVGRYLMDHPIHLAWALIRDPVHPYRGPQSTAGIETWRDGESRGQHAAFRVELLNDGWNWPGGSPVALVAPLLAKGKRGAALVQELRAHTARQLAITSLIEQLPNPDNRIVPDFQKVDALGIPRPRVHYHIDAYTRAGRAQARAQVDRIFAALGATERHHRDELEGGGHVMGTTRMGTDPAASVVDADLRTHDHRNLYLVGSGAFPTGGTANPTLTIAALALRAADALQRALRS